MTKFHPGFSRSPQDKNKKGMMIRKSPPLQKYASLEVRYGGK